MAKSRKQKKKKILQNGGTLFEINHGQLKELQHIGKPNELGNMISCGACAMNQLGFPEDLVNNVSTAINKHSGGFPFLNALNVINTLQKRRDPSAPPASIYTWALSSGFGSHIAVERSTSALIASNQKNMTSIDDTMNAIKGIIETMDEGTGALLGIIWVLGGGHYVVIAKSNQGTPYIIEAQHGGLEGIYRGFDQVKNYFQKHLQVGYFMTFNNSKPYFDQEDQEWRLPQPDPEIKINRTSLRLARHMGDKRIIHADLNRTTKPPRLQRSKSFMPIDESYTVEDTDSEDEATTPAFGQPTSLFGQPTPSPPTPSPPTPSTPTPSTPMEGITTTPSPPTPAFGAPQETNPDMMEVEPRPSAFGRPSYPQTSAFGKSHPPWSAFAAPQKTNPDKMEVEPRPSVFRQSYVRGGRNRKTKKKKRKSKGTRKR
ncbi:hypothetical protein ceV_493 [Chrysochromulina ericina virus CeV-01B]|uniref:Uncharacterized protein n=1 Tax=Chrysochromulina ericina virus CeV-01B TaxID=3070830 RepID=A0A0N9R163_9VIRU|nr:hypothetical protein ceV_493 [Chrysochromulina ericina virus]ALH23399.1 hypothetical protein ceV_493 [Chrysochromulina ericina virus CeV-01B]